MRFTKWSALVVVPHAIVQVIAFLVVFGTNASDILIETVEHRLVGRFALHPLLLYPLFAPFSYYVVFAGIIAYTRRYGLARFLRVLGISVVLSAATLIASFFASLYGFFFLVVGASVLVSWMERLGTTVRLVSEYAGFFLGLLGFGSGGALFGIGLALGLAVMRLQAVTRRSLLANASGCAIGALLLFSSELLLQLPWTGGDRDPNGPLPWVWLPIAVIAAIPHVYLTWRAFRRAPPVVAPDAG